MVGAIWPISTMCWCTVKPNWTKLENKSLQNLLLWTALLCVLLKQTDTGIAFLLFVYLSFSVCVSVRLYYVGLVKQAIYVFL